MPIKKRAGQITNMSFAKAHLGLPKKLGSILGMANWPKEDRGRLAAAIEKRRDDLGLTQLQVWHAGGPSNSTLTALENGTQETIKNDTLHKLEKGLGWPPGTALEILRGAEAPTDLSGVPTDHLLSEIKRRIDGSGAVDAHLPLAAGAPHWGDEEPQAPLAADDVDFGGGLGAAGRG